MKKPLLILLLACSCLAFAQEDLDPTFTVGTGTDFSVLSVKELADGKIMIAGDFTSYNGNTTGRIARLNSDGSFDSTFTASLSGVVEAMLVDTDGKILVAEQYGGIRRFNADGSIDTSFTPPSFSGYGPYRIVKQGTKYIVAGDFSVLPPNGSTITDFTRLNSDGTLDPTFHSYDVSFNQGVNIFVDSSNRIIAFGTGHINILPAIYTNIIRFSQNGDPESSFTHFSSAAIGGSINAVAQQPDGKYIVTGNFESYNGAPKHLMVRLNEDGTVDETFNYTTTAGLPEDGIIGYDIIVRSNGKILVSGMFKDAAEDIEGTPDGTVPVYLTQLNADGSTDDTFNAPFNSNVFAIDLQADGKLLAGGWFSQYNNAPQKGLARFAANALAVNETQFNTFNVYPNPVNNILTVSTKDAFAANTTVQLYDILGKQVYNAVHTAGYVQVDMSGLTNGIYILKLTAEGKTTTQKIIKN